MSTEEVRKAVAAWLAHWYPEAVCAAVVVQLPDGLPNEVLVLKSVSAMESQSNTDSDQAEQSSGLTAGSPV
jgi:hypothetical protein